ncbi:MAG TPA: class I SAM-dependent methyltransferase [Actinomycetota bacterium]
MSIAFDQAAGYYDESRGIPREVEEQAADQVEAAVGPAARLLEMGVGTGRVALPLHRRGRQVVGVDLSLPMLERYRAKAAAEGLAPPPLLRADATRLPFRDACVDAVLEVHVLHLIPDWELALAEARRVLVPGGTVLIGRGGGHRGDQGPRMETLNRFHQLAAELGGGPRRVGADDDASKVAALVALGGTAETLEPVVWEQRETYAEALAAVEGRTHSFTWRLPDQVFHTAVGRLRAELEAAHPDLDTPQLAGHSFTLTAVRF